MNSFEVRPVGRIESTLVDPADAPRQGDEGAPAAWLVFDSEVLVVHPRGDQTRAPQGVFSTRSPHRPNPVGLHRVRVLAVDGLRVRVSDMEAVDGTPVVDVKPVLGDTR
jgi:tRNA (Thr-GGU) A37 N-methylase